MGSPSAKIFHLHFQVPDVKRSETFYTSIGIPIKKRLGFVDKERLEFGSEVGWDELEKMGFRLQLESLQTGQVSIILSPGTRHHFDHLGFCLSKERFEHCINRARSLGLEVRGPASSLLVSTGLGFRIEVHQEGDEVESTLGEWDDAHLEEVVLKMPDPSEIMTRMGQLLQMQREDPNIIFFNDGGGRLIFNGARELMVERFTVVGKVFPASKVEHDPDGVLVEVRSEA